MSKRGLKNINFPLHENATIVQRDEFDYSGLLLKPIWHAPRGTWEMGVSIADILLAAISVFFVGFVTSTLFMLVAGSAGVTALIIALVTGVTFYYSEVFNRDSDLRTHLSMILPWSMVVSGDYGVVTALLYNAVQIAAASAGGAFAKALGITISVLGSNVTPTSATAWWVSLFGASVVASTYVIMQKWRQEWESNTDNHARAVGAAAMILFALVLACFGANAGELRTFEPAFYFANYVATGFDFNAWMYIVLLTFAPALVASIVYLVTVLLGIYTQTTVRVNFGPRYLPSNLRKDDSDGNPNTIETKYTNARQRQTNGPIDATY